MRIKWFFAAVVAVSVSLLATVARCIASADNPASSSLRAGPTTLHAQAYPIKGPTEGLEPQKLDFRYAPKRWQACIGLPDDPHKIIAVHLENFQRPVKQTKTELKDGDFVINASFE